MQLETTGLTPQVNQRCDISWVRPGSGEAASTSGSCPAEGPAEEAAAGDGMAAAPARGRARASPGPGEPPGLCFQAAVAGDGGQTQEP